jgi:hypothetical protein
VRKQISGLGVLLLSAVLILFIPSCRPEPLAPQEPVMVLLSPSYGETLPAGPVEVRTYIENFKLTEAEGQDNVFGEGHFIYYLDTDMPVKPGAPAITISGTYFVCSETSYTWADVTPGTHTFSVQLVNNDNTPLMAPVTQRVVVDLVTQ